MLNVFSSPDQAKETEVVENKEEQGQEEYGDEEDLMEFGKGDG